MTKEKSEQSIQDRKIEALEKRIEALEKEKVNQVFTQELSQRRKQTEKENQALATKIKEDRRQMLEELEELEKIIEGLERRMNII